MEDDRTQLVGWIAKLSRLEKIVGNCPAITTSRQREQIVASLFHWWQNYGEFLMGEMESKKDLLDLEQKRIDYEERHPEEG